MGLFRRGEFSLHSGGFSRFLIDCEVLTRDDWETAAQMVRALIGEFSSVEGVPRGGLPLAGALAAYVGMSGPHLVVDDVSTTGQSIKLAMRDARDRRTAAGRSSEVVGCVLFSRGQLPLGVHAVFSMPQKFWPAPLMRGHSPTPGPEVRRGADRVR